MKSTVLRGKKVVLRSLKLSDAARFCQWLADPEVTKFLDMYNQPALTLAAERKWITQQRQSKDIITFAIDTIDGTHIGSVALRHITSPHRHASYGIMIGDKKYWGQGYGTEAGKLIIDYGFRKLKLHRIYLYVIAYNIRGQKSYEKIGFKVEGRFREHLLVDGQYHDRVVMGILKNEYLKKQNNK